MFLDAKPATIAPTRMQAKGRRKQTTYIEGWEAVAALDLCSKALSSLSEATKQRLRDGPLKEHLIENGARRGRKPSSLAPVEGDAKGSAYIAKRPASIELSQEEIDLLAEVIKTTTNENGVIAGFTEIRPPGPPLLAVNPQYAGDQDLLARAGQALAKAKGLPDDFIVEVAGEAKIVVSDDALDNVFGLDRAAIDILLPVIASICLRPKYDNKLEQAWLVIKRLIPEAEAAMTSRRKPPVRLSPKQTLARQLKASAKAEARSPI